jgi:hypothetical protein
MSKIVFDVIVVGDEEEGKELIKYAYRFCLF